MFSTYARIIKQITPAVLVIYSKHSQIWDLNLKYISTPESFSLWDPTFNLKSAPTDCKANRLFRFSIDMTIIYQTLNAPATTLASPLGTNSLVRFVSTSINQDVNPNIDNTHVNLTKGDRILIGVAIRFKQGVLLFDSQTRPNTWDLTPETIPIAGVFNEVGASIGIRTNENNYTISVDDKDVYTFQKRVREDATGVSYLANTDKPSILSNPVAVVISRV